MQTIKVKPVEITGHCRAKLTPADEFQIRGTRLENPRQSNLCCLALAHLPPSSPNSNVRTIFTPTFAVRSACRVRIARIGWCSCWDMLTNGSCAWPSPNTALYADSTAKSPRLPDNRKLQRLGTRRKVTTQERFGK